MVGYLKISRFNCSTCNSQSAILIIIMNCEHRIYHAFVWHMCNHNIWEWRMEHVPSLYWHGSVRDITHYQRILLSQSEQNECFMLCVYVSMCVRVCVPVAVPLVNRTHVLFKETRLLSDVWFDGGNDVEVTT